MSKTECVQLKSTLMVGRRRRIIVSRCESGSELKMETRMCKYCEFWSPTEEKQGSCDLITNDRRPGIAEIVLNLPGDDLYPSYHFETNESFFCNMMVGR